MHLLGILEEKISFNTRQFGFKKGVSTTDACFLLKEVLHGYTGRKDTAIAMFIDLSKAFDQVDHFLLGQKLIKRGVPGDVTLLLMHYLRNQSANIVWGAAQGHYRPVEKSVRQGGII